MTTVYDVAAADLIEAAAKELKSFKVVSPPVWAPFVKTGVGKELPPERPDWWYIRAASVLRKIYLKGPVGTRRLRAMYSSKKNRGVKQEKPRLGSGSIARKILQQLEEAKLVQNIPGKGRQITSAGMSFLDNIAHSLKN
ncbi:MAG: 30S ribosomal protein S19e [Methanobacteriota archaeon]|nr:MAG: 30S ribosomal protein S19e [Euryarchaeota archaeon]